MLIIKEDQLKQFVQELKDLLPQAYPVYKLAENHLMKNSFAWPGLEFVVDRFPHFTACIVRPSPNDPTYVPRRSDYMYNAVATDVNNFKTLLDQSDSINWKRAGYFQAIPENLQDVLEEVCGKRGSYIGPKQHTDFTATGWIVKPENVRAAVKNSPPEGIVLRRPDRDDIAAISTLWRYGAGTDETLRYLHHLHDHNFPMMGIYLKEELIGFGICSADMAMSAGYVKTEFRGQGLIGLGMSHIIEQMERIGQHPCYSFICEENIASKKATTKSGGERIEDWKVVYGLYKPLKCDADDPLLIWYNTIHGE